MSVVYLFCEANAVRIPFLGYGNGIFQQLLQIGGVWDAAQFGFVFQSSIQPSIQPGQLRSYFDVVCVVNNNVASNEICWSGNYGKISGQSGTVYSPRLHIFGFFEQAWDDNADNGIIKGGCGHYLSREENNSSLPPVNQPDSQREQNLPESPQNVAPFEWADKNSIAEKLPGHLLKKLETELRSRKYSLQTQSAYIYFNRLLCRILQKEPKEICSDDVTEFLAIMEKERGYSASSMNLAISAIKFFFRYVLRNDSINEQKRPNQNKTLPMVLSTKEIIKILSMERNPKHRLLLMLVYSSGLRVSEVVALKKEHIDLARQVVYIEKGKGRKDRYTMLSEKAALFIQEYYKHFGVEKWIFPGQPITRHLTIRSAQHIFDKAVRNAGITKKISIHGLRHTFATHLLESGTDIRYIQTLLGHANIRTTERYTHVAKRNVLKIKSPLDNIM